MEQSSNIPNFKPVSNIITPKLILRIIRKRECRAPKIAQAISQIITAPKIDINREK